MEHDLSKCVRAAAVAGWFTSLIGGIWVTVGWLVFLAVLGAKPHWLLTMWGGGNLGWDEVQTMMLWFIGVLKMIVFVFVLVSICLTITAHKLSKASQG
jgi:hypothetical protein